MPARLLVLVALLLAPAAPAAAAARVLVAAAANLAPLFDRLAPLAGGRGMEVVASYAATGVLYAQITAGAPFEVLLAADAERPRRLEAEGPGVPGSRFVYAVGRLALWSPAWRQPPLSLAAALAQPFRRLAIASPETAPYGDAARQALRALNAWERVAPRLVYGESVGQTLQFVASGAAELGFVALSQVAAGRGGGAFLVVPAELHAPLAQEAILLRAGEGRAAARAFLDFLRSPPARAAIRAAGYEVP